ncbi:MULTISPECIES: hypothetical protein [Rhodonellum]|uniref:DUF3352 domain-containing protein n=1 Tax=Rhodonellum ikkaensis TaxID=336829 RepID=A0A1H3U393_9BACT|nr:MULTISPECIES: hypothetical protein [Rhodonellum]SDZ56305.1 hypothetical protein SAMN05444412_12513 [Rhodonellum ikkaensis]
MSIIKQILVIVLVLSLGAASYFLYKGGFFTKETNALELISSEAIFVFETEEPIKAWNQLVTQPIWQRLSELPSIKNIQDQLVSLDSLVGRSGSLDRSLKGNQMAISLHAVGRDEFDFLFTIAFKKGADESFIKELEENLPDLSKIVKRNYSNIEIFEFQSTNLERNLTYSKIGNVLVASYTSFLVEEAIRFSQDNPLSNFKDEYKELFSELPSPKGLGVFRLSSKGLSNLVAGISSEAQMPLIQNFSKNKLAANLELKFAENKIVLDGIAVFLDGQKIDFKPLASTQGQFFSNYISNRTAAYFQYQVQNVEQLQQIENHGFQPRSTLTGDIEKNLIEKGFMENLKGQLAYLMLETVGNEPQDRVLLIQSDQVDKQIQLLKEFNLGLEKIDLSLIPVDYYQNQEIFMISESDFPAHLFDGKFMGFGDTYITGMENMLVFANSSKSLKIFIDDVYSDNTWGKSIAQRRFVQGVSGAAWFNFVINVPRIWNSVVEMSLPNWKVFFQKYAPQLKSMDMVAMNVSGKDGKNEVNLAFGYNLDPIKSVQSVVLTENKSVQFSDRLLYGPKSIQNFNDKSVEFVIQDELNKLYLITSEGEVVFSQELDGPVVSEVFQIDYYKNGKLQLLFATSGNIYAIDRFGVSIPGFPVNPAEEAITHLNLVDYSNNKDYRYFVATEAGNLFLLDNQGKALDGWNPKKVNGPLATVPAHHRIAGVGDQMLALSSKGELYLFNRRGEAQIGSPIRLGDALTTDYILLERGSAKDTRIVTITKDGEVVQVNFRGELTYRNQLLRPDRESKFNLVKDQNNDRYLFVVQEYNKVTIMDSEYKVLFTKDISAEEMAFQFFSFGGDKNLFVLIDKTQEFIYLYDLKGELLNAQPIGGTGKIEVKYSPATNEYIIYNVEEFRFKEYKLPI